MLTIVKHKLEDGFSMSNRIQIRRGLDSGRLTLDGTTDIKVGELLFATDTKRVFIGDGTTDGGFDFVGTTVSTSTITVSQIEDQAQGSLLTWDSSSNATVLAPSSVSGHVLQSQGTGADLLYDYIDPATNVDSADFITDLSSAPAANKFVDAATIRQYVIDQVGGLAWRPPVDYCDDAGTSPANTSKPTTTATQVDGNTIVDGDRVLFAGLTVETADNNKVFIASVSGTSITWTVETDGQDSTGDPTDGDTLFCQRGDVNADRTFNYNGTSWILISNLNGAVSGPVGSVTDNAVVRFDGTTGQLVQNSGVTIDDSNVFSGGSIDSDNVTLSIDFTTLKDETAGDLLYWDASSNVATLPIGSEGQVLAVSSGIPAWIDAASASADVQGPASAADNEIVRFDSTTGKLIQNGSVARLNDNTVVDSVTYGPLDGVLIDGGTV